MSPLYTRRGDEGKTDLFSGERVSKVDPRIEAYGTVDELNSVLGMANSFLENQHEDFEQLILEVQNDLHIISANLANTKQDTDRPEITEDRIERMERDIDGLDEELPSLTSFILPGGVRAASHLHHARTVSRRAERRTVEALEADANISLINIQYLNRLSDFLFILARAVNHRHNHKEETPTY